MLREPLPVPVVLAVDPGSTSGWAVFVRGDLVSAGEVSIWSAGVDEVIDAALDVADASGKDCPTAIVWETPGLGRTMHPRMMLSLGGSIGIWRRQWRMALETRKRPEPVEAKIPASTWRAAVIGGGASAYDSEEWKAESIRVAKTRWTCGDFGPESADASGLGFYACRSLVLADAFGKRAIAAMGFDERTAIPPRRAADLFVAKKAQKGRKAGKKVEG